MNATRNFLVTKKQTREFENSQYSKEFFISYTVIADEILESNPGYCIVKGFLVTRVKRALCSLFLLLYSISHKVFYTYMYPL